MSDFISKIGHLDPRFYSLIYCDTGGPDTGGPDVGGPDVGGPDVGGPDVRFPVYYITLYKTKRFSALCDKKAQGNGFLEIGTV